MIIQSLTFENYMAYKRFSIALSHFNILVGPNNSGKSTIIKSLQLFDAAWRSSIKRKPEYISEIENYGYRINESSLPFRIDNIHNEYSDVYTKIRVKFFGSGSAFLTINPEFRIFLHFRGFLKTSVQQTQFFISRSLPDDLSLLVQLLLNFIKLSLSQICSSIASAMLK